MPIDETGDIPPADQVEPKQNSRGSILRELLGRGETIVELRSGKRHELHGYDTHIYGSNRANQTTVYTQDGEENEHWFFTSDIVDFEQH